MLCFFKQKLRNLYTMLGFYAHMQALYFLLSLRLEEPRSLFLHESFIDSFHVGFLEGSFSLLVHQSDSAI